MRHNEIRDFTASLLDEVCGDVQIEPTLIPLSGEAQLGKSANTSSEASSVSFLLRFCYGFFYCLRLCKG